MIKVELEETGQDGEGVMVLEFESRDVFMQQWKQLLDRYGDNYHRATLVDRFGVKHPKVDMRYGYNFLSAQVFPAGTIRSPGSPPDGWRNPEWNNPKVVETPFE